MKTQVLLSVMMSMCMSLSAMPKDNVVRDDEPSAMERQAARLRYELKRESDERKQENSAPVHMRRQPALMEEELTYKERLDSLVSVGENKQMFTYDDFGNMLTSEQLKWENDAWAPNTLDVKTYDADRLVTSTIRYVYKDADYVPSEASYSKYYDADKNQIISGYAKWNEERQDWRFQYLAVSELDELGREVSYTYYLGWDDTSWQPSVMYDHYEVRYLDDEVIETTWYNCNGEEPTPNHRRRVKSDNVHHYTVMYEDFYYLDGKWSAYEYNEERRMYYGTNTWEYKTVYHENKSGYTPSLGYSYGYKYVYAYDEQLTETLYEYYDWDYDKQQWKAVCHREHAYRYYQTEWGMMSQVKLNLTLDGWSDTYDTWASGYKTEQDFDRNGEWTFNAQATWVPETKDWNYSFKERCDRIYDDEDRLILVEQMIWNVEAQEWEHPFISSTYEYADDGLVTLTQYENWDSAEKLWKAGSKSLNLTDERGNLVYEDHSRWDGEKQAFVPSFLKETIYIYDDDSREGYMWIGKAEVYKLEYSNWDEELNTWGYGKKTESEYDETYDLIHRLTSYWIPKSESFYLGEELQQEFDEWKQMIEFQLDTYSEDGNKNYEYHEKWSKRYDENQNVVEENRYGYNLNQGEYWLNTHTEHEYDLTTSAREVMGLNALQYYKDKPLRYLYQEYNRSGKELKHEERYFYYSEVRNEGEGIEQTMAPVTVDVEDGRLTFGSEMLADLTISTLDGRVIASVQQVHNYGIQLATGVYVVTVNGVSRKLKI